MVMPDTGLFDEPTRPARYADTDTNRKPATIMMIAIGMLTPHWPRSAWYSSEQRQHEEHQRDQHPLHRQVAFGLGDDVRRRPCAPRRCRS